MILYLLSHGADVNATTKTGITVVDMADGQGSGSTLSGHNRFAGNAWGQEQPQVCFVLMKL